MQAYHLCICLFKHILYVYYVAGRILGAMKGGAEPCPHVASVCLRGERWSPREKVKYVGREMAIDDKEKNTARTKKGRGMGNSMLLKARWLEDLEELNKETRLCLEGVHFILFFTFS